MRRAIIAMLSLVALVGVLAGCGSSHTPQALSFTAHITGTKSDLGDFSASEGDTVKLTFVTDKDEEVHLHGYDIHFECKANTPLEKTFTADKAGQFEYELEATSQHLGNLTVNP